MPLYDYLCPTCDTITEKLVFGPEMDITSIPCPSCGSLAEKQMPNTMKFVLKYNPKRDKVSWGNEGYARTQRYDAIDKQAKKNVSVPGGLKTD